MPNSAFKKLFFLDNRIRVPKKVFSYGVTCEGEVVSVIEGEITDFNFFPNDVCLINIRKKGKTKIIKK
jgi:hypothetical protein